MCLRSLDKMFQSIMTVEYAYTVGPHLNANANFFPDSQLLLEMLLRTWGQVQALGGP